MKLTKTNFEIYYEKHGNKRNEIIILPGWGETRKTFTEMINSLKDHFTVYIIDYPGFGKSPFPNKDLTIDDYAVLVKDFIEEKKLDTPIVISHSFGGRLTILLSTKYNVKFKKIIMIDAAGIKPKKKLKAILRTYIYKFLKKISFILPKQTRKKYLNKLITMFGSNDFKNLTQNMRKSFISIVNTDLTKHLSSIRTDTLLIWGEKDLDTPLKDAYKMNKLINDSGLVIIKNATHFSYLEYPTYINKIIFEFLKNLK